MAYQSQPSGPRRNDSTLSNDSTLHNSPTSPNDFRVRTTAHARGPSATSPSDDTLTRYKDDPNDPSFSRSRPSFMPDRTGERASFAPPKSTGDLRIWRHDERGNMWTKGTRGRVAGRFCCCTLMMTVFLIISIVLSLAMWARPPDITIGGLQLPTNSSGVQVQADSLTINLSLQVSVKNPNFFSATLKSLQAKAFYPPLTSQVGGGSLSNVVFPSDSNTNFLFPFIINYSTAIDPQNILIQDLINKCGIKPGSTMEPLTINYDIALSLRIIAVTIPPSFSGSATFDCPVTRQDLLTLGGQALLDSLGAS